MSDDRHIRIGHNEFMADTYDLLRLANIAEELREGVIIFRLSSCWCTTVDIRVIYT